MAAEIITRADALVQGLTWYFTGVPCKRGHVARRRTNGGRVCEQCSKEHKARTNVTRRASRKAGVCLPAGLVISRRAAIQAGYGRYFTGTPCSRGHVSERQVSSSSCVECDRANTAANQWHKKNPERHLEQCRLWASRNRDSFRDIKRRSEHKRRAQKHSSNGTHTAADLSEILAAQGHRCAYCRANLKRVKKHVDHIKPLALGGSNGRGNLQYLCAPCNQSKSAKDPVDYAKSIGLLI